MQRRAFLLFVSALVWLGMEAGPAVAQTSLPLRLWVEVVPGVLRFTERPTAYAIVEGDRCLLIGAPRFVSPQTMPKGTSQCELLLLTHHHRDASSSAAQFLRAGVRVRAPELSAAYLKLEGVAAYWDKSMPVATPGRWPPLTERFWGDWTYLVHPIGLDSVDCSIHSGEKIEWRGWTLTAVATPGHSKDHVAFVAERTPVAGAATERLCFCGDAIASRGKMWSPYTMEWHHQKDDGFVAAAVSLRTLAALKPTHLLPEHGEPIVGDAINDALLETADRLEQVGLLKNFDAYSKQLGSQPAYKFLAPEQVGTANASGNPLPWTKLSPHLLLSGNTYALASKDGPVLLMDPYSQNIVERVAELKRDHGFGPLEVAMISHGHNDHYTGLFALPDRDRFQVWTLDRIADVVDHPHRFLAPYVDVRVPNVDRRVRDGEVVKWHEYELVMHHLPGQTVFGMGVEVRVDGQHCLFTGDNFYHVEQYSGGGGWSGRNRGLPLGYAASAEKILKMQPDWILAEHGGAFVFNAEDFRRRRDFALRAAELADRISPSGNHRVDWDPQRVSVEPLIVTARQGGEVRVRLVAHNPTQEHRQSEVSTARPEIVTGERWTIGGKAESNVAIEVVLKVAPTARVGRHVVPLIVSDSNGIDSSDTFVVLDVQP